MSSDERPSGPVIVLTYVHAGAEALIRLLSASRSLACTSGTGLLPLCHAAISTWGEAEGNDGQPSALALSSVRALASAMITVIQARYGARRWCETAFAGYAAASTFLQVFPTATFICLHRSLPAVAADGLAANPWGLGGSPFWAYSGQHPGNNAATVASYWASYTEQLLGFESQHPQSCLRLHHEEITTDPLGVARRLFARLGLDPRDLAVLRGPGRLPYPDGAIVDAVPELPVEQLPPQLIMTVTDLSTRLGYQL